VNELVLEEKLTHFHEKTFSFMGQMMSGQLHATIALFPKTYPRYSSAIRLDVPHSRFGQFGEHVP
jgi:hypothetical protein